MSYTSVYTHPLFSPHAMPCKQLTPAQLKAKRQRFRENKKSRALALSEERELEKSRQFEIDIEATLQAIRQSGATVCVSCRSCSKPFEIPKYRYLQGHFDTRYECTPCKAYTESLRW